MREERRLRVFENRVLWGMFGSKRDEVTGEWREILTEEPYHLYCSHNIFLGDKIEKIERSGACSTYGEGRGAYRILVGKPEGKRPFGRLRHTWEDNIKIHFQEIKCGVIDWIKLTQVRESWWALVNAVLNLRFHKIRGIG